MQTTKSLSEISDFVYERFAQEVGLPPAVLMELSLTLSDVAQRSPKISNSVDLMECFARTANAVRREYGVRVRLPAYPGNTPIRTLVDNFVEQAKANISKEAQT